MLKNTLQKIILLISSIGYCYADCEDISGLVFTQYADVIVFGELHGTNEIPDFFYQVVCNMLSMSSDNIIIGLELDSTINSSLKLNYDELDSAFSSIQMASRLNDGRHNARTLHLIKQLREIDAANRGCVLISATDKI